MSEAMMDSITLLMIGRRLIGLELREGEQEQRSRFLGHVG